jgi:hypothetical protein
MAEGESEVVTSTINCTTNSPQSAYWLTSLLMKKTSTPQVAICRYLGLGSLANQAGGMHRKFLQQACAVGRPLPIAARAPEWG